MMVGPGQPVMVHVCMVYHTMLKSDVETATKSSAKLALHMSISRVIRWSGLSSEGWSSLRW
eukprot:1973941-Prymnesium_polylepis.1